MDVLRRTLRAREPEHRWAVTARRRVPVDWRRYSVHAARARTRLPRYEHPLLLSVAASGLFALAGMGLLQLVGGGIGAGIAQISSSVASALPTPLEAELVIGEAPVTVSAAPVIDQLPEFTRSNAVTVAGKVPGFAVVEGRTIQLDVNRSTVGALPIGADGRFGPLAVTLADGVNTITARLMAGAIEIAASSATVTVDRTPPQVSITKPAAGAQVTGPEVTVEGRAETGAAVSVNGHEVPPNPDGTFSDRFNAPEGPLTLTVVARDKAGNETKQTVDVKVLPKSTTTGALALVIALDRTTVRPGETVVATILATENGQPKPGVVVTLQVGVITIGTYQTDASGIARVGFAAPNHEVDQVSVVALAGGTTARASLTVALPSPLPTRAP